MLLSIWTVALGADFLGADANLGADASKRLNKRVWCLRMCSYSDALGADASKRLNKRVWCLMMYSYSDAWKRRLL